MRGSAVRAIGLAGLGIGAIAIASRRAVDRRDRFYEWSGEHLRIDDGTAEFSLPMVYHRSEQIVSLHPAAMAPVRAILPTDDLHPVRLPDGRALVAVSAGRYLEGTADGTDPDALRYGEVMVGVLVTRRPAPPLVPLLRSMLAADTTAAPGVFILHNAVTSRASRDTARAYGYPAFVADFASEEDLTERRVHLAEDGRDILALRVAATGRISRDRSPMITYGIHGDEVVEAIAPCSALVQQHFGRRGGRLELGDHPVADMIRDLDPSPEPMVTRSYLNLRILIPPTRVVGRARTYTGYAGSDRELGTYTMRYPGGAAIDMHAGAREPGPVPLGVAVG